MKVVINLIFILLIGLSTKAQAQDLDPQAPDLTPRIFSEVAFSSSYWWRGLNQSVNSPAIQANLGYQFGKQFRLGVWGSSTRFEDAEDTSIVKLYGNYIIPFSSQSYLTIGVGMVRYYPFGSRNGQDEQVMLRVFDMSIVYEKKTNFEALAVSSKRYGAIKDFAAGSGWIYRIEGGYNTINSEDYQSYIDVKTGFIYPYDQVLYQLYVVGNSKPSQFPNRGGPSAIVGFTARF
jgi:uncharacterized protein (TIGR02001 family)